MDRQGHVTSITDRVRKGEYRVDPVAVAAAILDRIAVRSTFGAIASERVLPARERGRGSRKLQA
jgi:hypothetical protein